MQWCGQKKKKKKKKKKRKHGEPDRIETKPVHLPKIPCWKLNLALGCSEASYPHEQLQVDEATFVFGISTHVKMPETKSFAP